MNACQQSQACPLENMTLKELNKDQRLQHKRDIYTWATS